MANLKDVANKAGVSIATASRVMNHAGNISDETRFKVQKAMKELNYSPSRIAKRLRSKAVSGNLIGVMVPDISNPFYIDILRGIEEYMYNQNFLIIICNFSQDKKKEQLYLDALISESVDGLIVAPTHEKDPRIISLKKHNLPFVCIDRGLSGADADVVLVNNREGAFKAVDFLLKNGYTRIAYISGLPEIPTSRLRLQGYRDALEEHGLPYRDSLVKFGDSTANSGNVLAKELLTQDQMPDAIFAGNNLITLGVLQAVKEKGLRVPDDMGVIGFDDMSWSDTLDPPLTTVRQPAYEIGRRSAELLFQRIHEPDKPTAQVILKTELIIRKSTQIIH